MMLTLEFRKIRRTGFFYIFLGGSILAALFPVLNMSVRPESFTSLPGRPLEILLNANWQIMTMLNLLLAVIGSCILYHTETADNALRRMRTLPLTEGGMFIRKFLLTGFMYIPALGIELLSLTLCILHWFHTDTSTFPELAKNYGISLLFILPAVLLSLLISSIFRNMWISLGIGVICIFAATILPDRNFAVSLFPFILPFRIFADIGADNVSRYAAAAVLEGSIFILIEFIFLKARRYFE